MRSRHPGRLAEGSGAVLAAALALSLAAPPVAGEFNPLGDGSDYSNADLMRDRRSGCENCAPNPPHEWDDPWFDLDWSLALRGAYVHTTGTDYFEAVAIPGVSLRHETLRGGYSFSASAEVTRSTLEEVRLQAARIGLEGDYRLDAATGIAGAINLAVTQDSARAPGTDPTIAAQPLVVSGDGEVSVARDVGPLVFTGRLNASRTAYGETTLVDSSRVDNSHQNNWVGGGGLRVGYRITPVLSAFIDGSLAYQWYEGISPIYGVPLDAADYAARAGLSSRWNEVWEAEASAGYGLRRFADVSLGEVSSLLYDAKVTFRPDETLEFKGEFSTGFGAPGPDSAATARLEYAAAGEVGYTVNPWLKLRASAGWSHALLVGTPETETRYNVGLGADYVLNEFTTVTGDYVYANTVTTPDPAEDSHRVSVGLTFSR